MMNDKLLEKILHACEQSSDMVCELSELKFYNTKEWSEDCFFDEGRYPLGCAKCMAEIVDWLRSKGVI